ncbi:MAG: hypothetical protein IPG96_04900 [Proteobacteria bacterium]|nr:hypothetical protein [Pseudomonadota bacterium]
MIAGALAQQLNPELEREAARFGALGLEQRLDRAGGVMGRLHQGLVDAQSGAPRSLRDLADQPGHGSGAPLGVAGGRLQHVEQLERGEVVLGQRQRLEQLVPGRAGLPQTQPKHASLLAVQGGADGRALVRAHLRVEEL